MGLVDNLYFFCKWVVKLAAFIILNGCLSNNQITLQKIEHINANYAAKHFWLKQSLYAGQFYDDNRYRLINHKPFDQVKLLTALDGEIILPPEEDEIIPMGTKVYIDKIEWPTGKNVFKRPIFTPRYNPWAYLFIDVSQKNRADLNKPYILVLPSNIANEKEAINFLDTFLSKTDLSTWIASLKSEVHDAIVTKKALIGMTHKELMASLGLPDELINKKNKEIATYGSTVIVLENNQVSQIKTGG